MIILTIFVMNVINSLIQNSVQIKNSKEEKFPTLYEFTTLNDKYIYIPIGKPVPHSHKDLGSLKFVSNSRESKTHGPTP